MYNVGRDKMKGSVPMEYDRRKVYEMIYGRRSVRRYADALDMSELKAAVDTGLAGASSLPGQAKPTVQVLSAKAAASAFSGIVGAYGKVKSPAYLLFSAKPQKDYLTQAGYVGEQLALWLTSQGYGTCWIGIPLNTGRLIADNPLPPGETYIILMAAGKPAEGTSLLRDMQGYNRKALPEMVTGQIRPEWRPILKAARIAPSASNGQPWLFACKEEGIDLYCVLGRGPIQKKFYHRLNEIDGGIALAHITLAAWAAGYAENFKKINGPASLLGKDMEGKKLIPIMGISLEKKPE